MTKQQQFLWIVQTAIMVNTVQLTVDRDAGQDLSDISMTGNWGAISDAPRASETIPDDMDADTAANEYCTFMLSNQREVDEATHRRRMLCPAWFARA